MKCFKCGYEWESRKESPKSCPRCKTRFDYIHLNTKEDHNKVEENLSEVAQKLPISKEEKYIG